MKNSTSNTNPLVTLVDSVGNVKGYTDKMNAHRRGQLHLAFSLMIVRRRAGDLEYLLQRRALGKYHSGGLWANTCCSHPSPNEDIFDAAQRRAKEELGIEQALTSKLIGQIYYHHVLDNSMIEHELDNILVAQVDTLSLQENPAEVMQVKWWKHDEIVDSLAQNPVIFTAWFKEVFDYIAMHQTSIRHPEISGAMPNADQQHMRHGQSK